MNTTLIYNLFLCMIYSIVIKTKYFVSIYILFCYEHIYVCIGFYYFSSECKIYVISIKRMVLNVVSGNETLSRRAINLNVLSNELESHLDKGMANI